MKILDRSGLERLWLHIVGKLGEKVDRVEGKGLSTNDYTTEDKQQLNTLSTLVGNTAVATQISEAISAITPESIGALEEEDYYGIVKKEGNIVSAESLNGLAISAASYITATQSGSGTPSPDNIRPITGYDTVNLIRTGKNLLGFNDYNVTGTGVYADSCSNGNFKREVKQQHTTTFAIGSRAFANIINPNIKAGTYTFTLKQTAGTTFVKPYLEITLNDGTKVNMANGVETTITQDGTITGVRMNSTQFSAGVVIEFVLQLEAGVATEYEPYNGIVLTANLPETVYGGKLDWLTGELTVTHKMTTLTSASGHWAAGSNNFWINVNDRSENTTLLSNRFVTSSRVATQMLSGEMCLSATYPRVVFANPNNALTADEWKAQIDANPIQLVYELAEPYTFQLTPQQLKALQGFNAVWSDCGDTYALFNYSLSADTTDIVSITNDEIDAICTSALEINNTLVDEVTGTSYRLYVSDGKLTMAEVNN